MDDAIRIGAAATALGVSIDTLRRWERDGRVAFERRGQQRWMTSGELARLLRERGVAGGGTSRNRLTGAIQQPSGLAVWLTVPRPFRTLLWRLAAWRVPEERFLVRRGLCR